MTDVIKRTAPFEDDAGVTARYLQAATGLSSGMLASSLKMSPRDFGRLLKGSGPLARASADFNRYARAVYETFAMETKPEALGGAFYADTRPRRRDGTPIIAVGKKATVAQ